jgi:shikimate dehydrogenase
MVRCVALLGHPVGHSVSPAMQEAAFAHVGLPWRFLPFDVASEHLREAIRGLQVLGFVGANVTVPHKLAALALADQADGRAAGVGAANTLVFRNRRCEAYNTDVAGFSEDVDLAFGGGTLRGARVLVIGAGGAARAVLAACIEQNAWRVTVLNRSLDRAEALIKATPRTATLLAARPLRDDTFAEALDGEDGARIVVQTTNVGMAPSAEASPVAWPERIAAGLCVYDVIYNPLETRFLREAAARGARTRDGLGMLVAQGAHAFELWTGQPAPREVMFAAAREALPRT